MQIFSCIFDSLKIYVIQRLKGSPEISAMYFFKILRFFGVWCIGPENESFLFYIYNRAVTLTLCLFAISATLDLYYSASNLEDFMDSICILIGIYLILFKVIRFQTLILEIRQAIEFLNARSIKIYKDGDKHSKNIYTSNLLMELVFIWTFFCLGAVLFVAVVFHPIFSRSFKLPFRAKFPFSTAPGSNGYMFAYFFQTICCFYLISDIVIIDGITMIMINQLCLLYEILCENFKNFGKNPSSNMKNDLRSLIKEHQKLIRLADYINTTQHSMFVMQVISSVSIICLTGLQITLTRDMSTRIKFGTYMVAEFCQMFEWCWFGSKISSQSIKLADAAFQSLWIHGSKQIQNDLRFVILRAQKPLVFRPSPFSAFNFESFLNILRASYSYFTLLNTLTQ